jgi:surfeit locus 1 family protein
MAIRFKPGMASTLTFSVLLPLLIALGVWQLDRAQQKRVLFGQYQAQLNAEEIDLAQVSSASATSLLWRKVRVTGEFTIPNILLDNRVRNSRAGYEVFAPFVIENHHTILINRGWIPADSSRKPMVALDLPSGPRTLKGRIGPIPWNGINLGSSTVEHLGSTTLRVVHLVSNDLAPFVNSKLPEYVVMLDPAQREGFDCTWPSPISDDGKHRAYAFQWFMMALTLTIIYLKISIVTTIP